MATRTLAVTIIGLARAFNMTTVAEGVETQAQLEFLRDAGCNESQGYLHSRPVSAPDFELLMSQHSGVLAPPAPSANDAPFCNDAQYSNDEVTARDEPSFETREARRP